jgi:hypothetical protein
VKVTWTPRNIEKVQAHGLTRAIAEMPHQYVPLEELEKNLDRDASYAEKHFGPDVPRLIPRGRPRKGTVVEAGKVHTVRVPGSLWNAAKCQAERLGLSPNAAVQLALRAWTEQAASR